MQEGPPKSFLCLNDPSWGHCENSQVMRSNATKEDNLGMTTAFFIKGKYPREG